MSTQFKLKPFILFWTLFAVIAGLVLWVAIDSETKHRYDVVQEQQKRLIEKSVTTLKYVFRQARNDVLYLATLDEFDDYLEANRQSLQKTLHAFLATHLKYDHLRFIDNAGQEAVRVNNIEGMIIDVTPDSLQDKNDRPYYRITTHIEKGQIYISDFEFNVENGKVQQPLRTVIRFATPVFNKQGERLGVIVADLKGDNVLQRLYDNANSEDFTFDLLHYHADHNDYFNINHESGFTAKWPGLLEKIGHGEASWGLIENDLLLGTFYFFNKYIIPEHPFAAADDSFRGSEWLVFVYGDKQEVIHDLIFPNVHPATLWGGFFFFISILAAAFTYLRVTKTHFQQNYEKQVALMGSFFSNTPDAYVIKDLQGRVVYTNQVANDLFNHGRDLTGQIIKENDTYQTIPELDEMEEKVIGEEEARQFDLMLNNQHYHISVFPILNARGDLILTGCIVGDQSHSLRKAEKHIQSNIELFEAISQTQSQFMNLLSRKESFNYLLKTLIDMTNSEFGFIGEVFLDDQNQPYLKTQAISNIAWNEETRMLYVQMAEEGFEFRNLDTLFGEVLITEEVVIANEVATDSRARGVPRGHPPLKRFMGVPVFYQDRMIGMVGVANSEAAYSEQLVNYVQPLIKLYGQMIHLSQVQREKELVEKALSSKEQWLSVVVDTAPDGILVVDEAGKIVMSNHSVNRMFGYEQNELIDLPVEVLVPESIREQHPHNRTQYMQSASNASLMTERTVQGLRKDQSSVPVEIRLSPIIEDEHETYVICSVRDVTERLEIEKQLRQSQKMDAIGQLTGGIAHDFNNLLGVVQGNLDLADLSLEESDSEGAKKAIDNAQQSAERGAKLIQRLLAFARKQPLVPQPVCLKEVIDDVAPMLRHALGSKIRFEKNYAEDVGLVNLDQNQFENALINLAVNAKDAMQGKGVFTVSVEYLDLNQEQTCVGGDTIAHGSYVLVTVADTGTGMTPEMLEHIFEPFYTNKQVGKGTGLGLAMVYGFVRQSNGYIQAHSQLGQGTEFKFYFPTDSSASKPNDTSTVKLDTNTDKMILVVDDEEALLEAATKMLRRAGYQVLSANSADEAAEVLKTNDVDLLFTDIVMPGEMDGIALVQYAQSRYPNLKFVVGTGYAADALDSLETQWIKEFLIQKPYREATLLKKIDWAFSQPILTKSM